MRIPKFKVGDWVQYKGNKHISDPKQVTIIMHDGEDYIYALTNENLPFKEGRLIPSTPNAKGYSWNKGKFKIGDIVEYQDEEYFVADEFDNGKYWIERTDRESGWVGISESKLTLKKSKNHKGG